MMNTSQVLYASSYKMQHKLHEARNNFGITRREFYTLKEKVKQGDESLFTQIFKMHFSECIKYLKIRYKISDGKAHDISMDTLLEFRQKLIQGKIEYGNLRYLFSRMASNNYIDSIKKAKRTDNAEKVYLDWSDYFCVSNEKYSDSVHEVLHTYLGKLNSSQKELIKELFYSEKSSKQIVMEYGITSAALRKRKQRILDKIREGIREELSGPFLN